VPGGVQRVGDKNSAGGIILTGNPTVLVNGRPIATVGASVSPHPCCGARGCPPVHCAALTTATSPTILVGGEPVCTTGDLDTCGHSRLLGSFDVIVGI
jgi:uncharacterized Zn-binding protein involved in type VI secretion